MPVFTNKHVPEEVQSLLTAKLACFHFKLTEQATKSQKTITQLTVALVFLTIVLLLLTGILAVDPIKKLFESFGS